MKTPKFSKSVKSGNLTWWRTWAICNSLATNRSCSTARTEVLPTPHQLLDRLARLVTPPRRHKHRYCGVQAPNANLRQAVTASAGPAGSTLQVLEQARRRMALPVPASAPDPPADEPRNALSRAASRCWALLLVRIHECLPLLPPRSPPQGELGFDQAAPGDPWPEMDQTAAGAGAGWE